MALDFVPRLIAIFLCSCDPVVDLQLPIEGRTQSLLLISEGPQGDKLFAIEAEEEQRWSRLLHDEGDLTLTALQYQYPLREWGLVPGDLVTTRSKEDPSFPLPEPFDHAHTGVVNDLGFGGWSTLDLLSESLKNLRIETLLPRDCITAGGCMLVGLESAQAPCVDPCPTPEPPEPAVQPEPVRLTPCPSGWIAVEDQQDQLTLCEPWANAADCSGASAQFPGEAGCRVIGPPCPTGRWAESLPGGPILYVAADAGPGGDGSEASPFRQISDALGAASGTTIALAKGTYQENVSLPRGVALWGACVEETILEVSSGSGVLLTDGSSVTNLQLRGGWSGLSMTTTGSASADNIYVTDAQYGLQVSGGTIGVAGFITRNTSVTSIDITGGQASVTSAVLHVGNFRGAQVINTASQLQLQDCAILSDGSVRSRGVQALRGSHLELSRCLIEGTGTAVLVQEGSSALLTDLVVRDLAAGSSRESAGLTAILAGIVRGSRIRVDRAFGFAVIASDQVQLELTDLVIRDTQWFLENGQGRGLIIGSESQANLERALLTRNYTRSLTVTGEGSRLEASDLVVGHNRDREEEMGTMITGLWVSEAAEVQLRRARFERNQGHGIFIEDPSTLFDASDLSVVETLPRAHDGGWGRGMEVWELAQVTVTRGSFLRNRNAAVLGAQAGTTVRLTDLHIAETTDSDVCVDYSCYSGKADAVSTTESAKVEVERFLLERNEYGVRIGDHGEMVLKDGVIADNDIGAFIAVDKFEVKNLAERVLFRDNQTPLVFLIE